ncbi:hypothetical protein O0L34_g12578 [Tuta absoluta]|nr:hypothetical protein O0L34_g12578 [Tuta absoluta]
MNSFLFFILGAACFMQANAAAAGDAICVSRNAYYPIELSCDGYYECKEGQAAEMLCPDGLHFNPRAVWPEYPCSYPMDVTCEGDRKPQPAQPTADCPHQFGFFASPQSSTGNCGQYRMCVDGQAIEMMCPPGLAFNPQNARCDWPDLVSSCKAEEFLNFQCPTAPLGENGEPLEVVNYKYEGDCFAFYSCEKGHPRLLTCDAGFAFDEASGHCVDSSKVNCFTSVQITQL